MLPHHGVGEGYLARTPHPFEWVDTPFALSRKGRGHERREPRVWQESESTLMLRDAAQRTRACRRGVTLHALRGSSA